MSAPRNKDWRRRGNYGQFISTQKVFEPILKDASVRNWILKLKKKAGWRTTVPGFLRTLYRFSKHSSKSPNELVNLSLEERKTKESKALLRASSEIQENAQKYIGDMLNAGKHESARYTRACLKSFFKANGVSLYLDPIPKFAKKSETIPTRQQVYAMADATHSPRDRAIILCMYQSGLGITPLRNLNYAHIEKEIDRGRTPIRIHITSEVVERPLPVAYYAFFGTEAVEALKTYIKARKRRIKKLSEQGGERKEPMLSGPLFVSKWKKGHKGGRMAISSIWRIIKSSAEKIGLDKEKIWPHCLRKSFKAELDRSPLEWDTKRYLIGRPVPGKEYDINEVEQCYSMCNLSRNRLDKLGIIKEFVSSLGIRELKTKIKRVENQIPEITEEDALRFLVRTEIEYTNRRQS